MFVNGRETFFGPKLNVPEPVGKKLRLKIKLHNKLVFSVNLNLSKYKQDRGRRK